MTNEAQLVIILSRVLATRASDAEAVELARNVAQVFRAARRAPCRNAAC
jgi:hypothetical protein